MMRYLHKTLPLQTSQPISELLQTPSLEKYKDIISLAFQTIMSPELKVVYLVKLCTTIDTLKQQEIPKITDKIIEILTTNLIQVLQDQELPINIKKMMIEDMPEMARILGNIFTQNPANFLKDSSGQCAYTPYKMVAAELRDKLIKAGEPAGVSYAPRSPKLFAWCLAELPETAHPMVGYLFEFTKTEERLQTQTQKIKDTFESLHAISNLLILQIACGDDIADNIQDKIMTQYFARIPFAPAEEFQDISRKIGSDGIYTQYFDQAVTIWKDAILQLEKVFGKEHFDTKVKPGFLETYFKIMESLTYSQHMNCQPHDKEITQDTILAKLAPNMMVECFRYLELCMCHKLALELKIDLPLDDIERIKKIVAQSQKSASAANGAATGLRELYQNDQSSQTPFAINDTYKASLATSGELFVNKFEHFIKVEGYTNHFFTTYYANANYDDPKKPTFTDHEHFD